MPELPDAVVYVEALERHAVGRRLEKIRLTSPFLLRSYRPPIASAEGKEVVAVRRLGKRIVLGLEEDLFLVFHLMIAARPAAACSPTAPYRSSSARIGRGPWRSSKRFADTNVERVVKVLNACGLPGFNDYWTGTGLRFGTHRYIGTVHYCNNQCEPCVLSMRAILEELEAAKRREIGVSQPKRASQTLSPARSERPDFFRAQLVIVL